MYIHIHTYILMCSGTYTCMNMYTYTYIYVCRHIYTHIHKLDW